MYPRLEPKTNWTGGRISDVDVLTLAEAASMASKHSSAIVTEKDFLRAAGRGEILLRAVLARKTVMRPCRDNDGELAMPANCIPTLPLTACQALANVGRAAWRHVDGHELVNSTGGQLCRFMRWKLPEGEDDIITTVADCRVTGHDIHALADAYLAEPKPESRQPPAVATIAADETICAFAEQVRNGAPVDWPYWAARLKITPHEAAKLAHCIDPVRWLGTSFAQGTIDTELQIRISKCSAMLDDQSHVWTLQRLVEYLGDAGAPFGMKRAAQSQQFIDTTNAIQAAQSSAPPPITRINSTSGPTLKTELSLTKPNWARWRRLDIVPLWEAACLLVDIEPPRENGEAIWATYQIVDLPPAFHEVWEAVNSDANLAKLEILEFSGRMLWKVNLAGFVQWAIDKGFQPPAELISFAAGSPTAASPSTPTVSTDSTAEAEQTSAKCVPAPVSSSARTTNSIASNGLTKEKILTAFEDLLNGRYGLRKAMGDGETKWLLDARISKGTPGRGGHKAQWNPLLLAVALREKGYATKADLNRAFFQHSFLAEWRDEWKLHEDSLD